MRSCPTAGGAPWDLWERVEALIDRAPSVDSLRAHRVHLIAARLWRARGIALPTELARARLRAEMITLAAPALLERARDAYDGQLILMKGPEVAARYADPADRLSRDLDLLPDDAPAAQRALIAAGFVEVGNPAAYADAQHLCPLVWPGLPLIIELHRHPSHPSWLPRVSATDVFQVAVPSATGVAGLLAPSPAAHALLLVAHGWSHDPLGRLADVVDVAAVVGPEEREAAAELARRWGWERMWQVSLAATDAVLKADGRDGSPVFWARHLKQVRERTVLQNHIARVAAPACTLPAGRAHVALGTAIRQAASRRGDEYWADKLRRSRLALSHAFMTKSTHERVVSSGPMRADEDRVSAVRR